MPVIGFLIFALLFIVGLIFLFHLLIIVAVIGGAIFAIAFLYSKIKSLFVRKSTPTYGRTIDHEGDPRI